jgi:hypothetical protein
MRQFLLMIAFVITVGATAAGAEPARSPNVVFILPLAETAQGGIRSLEQQNDTMNINMRSSRSA